MIREEGIFQIGVSDTASISGDSYTGLPESGQSQMKNIEDGNEHGCGTCRSIRHLRHEGDLPQTYPMQG
jgi:hypothetical protein